MAVAVIETTRTVFVTSDGTEFASLRDADRYEILWEIQAIIARGRGVDALAQIKALVARPRTSPAFGEAMDAYNQGCIPSAVRFMLETYDVYHKEPS